MNFLSFSFTSCKTEKAIHRGGGICFEEFCGAWATCATEICLSVAHDVPQKDTFLWRMLDVRHRIVSFCGASSYMCRHSGNQGTTGQPAKAQDTLQKISLRTRLSKPGEPREGFSLDEGPLLERASQMSSTILLRTRLSKPGERARRGLRPRGIPSPRSKLYLRDRVHMGSAPSAESRARLRAVTPASQLPFPCINQSTKRHQAKELQGFPLW